MVKFVMPDNLSDETQKFIKDVVKELNARKAIQNIDLGAIRMQPATRCICRQLISCLKKAPLLR